MLLLKVTSTELSMSPCKLFSNLHDRHLSSRNFKQRAPKFLRILSGQPPFLYNHECIMDFFFLYLFLFFFFPMESQKEEHFIRQCSSILYISQKFWVLHNTTFIHKQIIFFIYTLGAKKFIKKRKEKNRIKCHLPLHPPSPQPRY